MFTCTRCLTQFTTAGNFCDKCGARMSLQPQQEVIPPQPGFTAHFSNAVNPHQAAARGFERVFGLHPGIAVFTIAVNLMLFGKDGLALVFAPGTGGLDLLVALAISMAAGATVGYVTYLGQQKWYGDDDESAKIKGMITGVLTAIPTGLPGMLFGSAAIAGSLLRGKRQGG